MTSLRVEPDNGPPVSFLPGGSSVTEDEDALDILSMAVTRLKQTNKVTPAREISLAITRAQEAIGWLKELRERR